MTNITIPPEAIEAARKAFTEAMLTEPQPDPIEAACLAMLRNWPGGETVTGEAGISQPCIYLPLTENPYDKA